MIMKGYVGSNDKMIKSTKDMLKSRFDMKSTRPANVILGMKTLRISDELILSQWNYVDNVLEKFNKDDYGVARTPIDVSLHLSKNKGDNVSQLEYSGVIGRVIYLIRCARSDIAYKVIQEPITRKL